MFARGERETKDLDEAEGHGCGSAAALERRALRVVLPLRRASPPARMPTRGSRSRPVIIDGRSELRESAVDAFCGRHRQRRRSSKRSQSGDAAGGRRAGGADAAAFDGVASPNREYPAFGLGPPTPSSFATPNVVAGPASQRANRLHFSRHRPKRPGLPAGNDCYTLMTARNPEFTD